MTESQHWYTRDGAPCHTQPTKKGAKNPTRPTWLSDAVRLCLLPSVSGYLGVVAKPALQRWRDRKITDAAHGMARLPDKDAFHAAVIERAFEEVGDAADVGTIIHAALEKVATGGDVDVEQVVVLPTTGLAVRLGDIIIPVIEKEAALGLDVIACERVLVNLKHGYAGTTDKLWKAGVGFGCLDYKTKKTKYGEPIYRNDEYVMQLAAYIEAHWPGGTSSPSVFGYNVYISTTEPGRVDIVRYGADELSAAWEAFKGALAIWRYKNNYDPRVLT